MTALLALDAGAWMVVLLIVVIAGWLHGALGLGFPLLATPVLATMMDVRSAILVTLLPTMAVNIASIAGSRQGFAHAGEHVSLIVFILLGSLLGTALLASVDPAPFRLLLAALILLYLWGKASVPASLLHERPLLFAALFGLGAGMAAGVTNVMVAVLIVYFLSLQTPRNAMVPAMNACFLTGKVTQFMVLALAGLVSARLLLITLPLAVAAVAALFFGQRVRSGLAAETYQGIMRWLLLLLALVLAWQFLAGIGP